MIKGFFLPMDLIKNLHDIFHQVDCFINGFTPEFYSISYRAAHNFSAEEILPAKNLIWDLEQYQKWLPDMEREAGR